MYLNKITLGLLVVYVIINALFVLDLSKRLEVTEITQHVIREQGDATSRLLLIHIDLKNLERSLDPLKNKGSLYNIYPQIKYD